MKQLEIAYPICDVDISNADTKLVDTPDLKVYSGKLPATAVLDRLDLDVERLTEQVVWYRRPACFRQHVRRGDRVCTVWTDGNDICHVSAVVVLVHRLGVVTDDRWSGRCQSHSHLTISFQTL